MENKSKNILIVLFVLVVVVLITFFLLNKNNEEKMENKEVKGEIVLTDLEEKIKTESPVWSNYWIAEDTGSNLSMFIKVREKMSVTEIEYPYDFKENRSDLREKMLYYIYSPDRTKILDAHGYVELEEKDGKIIEGYDVDSRVSLIDVKTNKFKQILTCGTPCGFSDAVWIDNNYFIVLGNVRGFIGSECKIYKNCQYPSLYLFDLLKNKYTLYYGPERLLEIEKEETPSETYTYKNHGFTIELPKGFVPKERERENGPGIVISLPIGGLVYANDASNWEQYQIPSYTYIKDEKIGDSTFKVYTYSGTRIYWFKKGNIGYEFSINEKDKTELENLIKTFKFVGWPQQ